MFTSWTLKYLDLSLTGSTFFVLQCCCALWFFTYKSFGCFWLLRVLAIAVQSVNVLKNPSPITKIVQTIWTCMLNFKHAYCSDARFLHVRNILDETKEKGCYALNAMLVSTEYMWNVQEKPRKAAFQLSTWCRHFQHSCIQANMQLNLHVEMLDRLEKWKFDNNKNVLTTWSGHARPSARPPIYMSKTKRKTTLKSFNFSGLES